MTLLIISPRNRPSSPFIPDLFQLGLTYVCRLFHDLIAALISNRSNYGVRFCMTNVSKLNIFFGEAEEDLMHKYQRQRIAHNAVIDHIEIASSSHTRSHQFKAHNSKLSLQISMAIMKS